jgi:hypothetical protein
MNDEQQQTRDAGEDLELTAENAGEVVGGDGRTTEPTPTEEISFHYGKVEWKYTP